METPIEEGGWSVDSEGAIYVHTERGNMSPQEYIHDLLAERDRLILEEMEAANTSIWRMLIR